MRVFNLTKNSKVYTSNVFYVLCDWYTLNDTNTLIDVGNDPNIFEQIDSINAKFGKIKIDQIILTHSHSDHIGLLSKVIEKYRPERVYAMNKQIVGVNHKLKDGQKIKIGDKFSEVFHISNHSPDSVCIYCKENKILFAGDTFFPIEFENDSLKAQNAFAVSRLERRTVKKVFYGHGKARDYSDKKFLAYKRVPQ